MAVLSVGGSLEWPAIETGLPAAYEIRRLASCLSPDYSLSNNCCTVGS